MIYGIVFISAVLLSALLTPLVAFVARTYSFVDLPLGGRKIHEHPMPLLGGIAPFVSLVVIVLVILFFAPNLVLPQVTIVELVGVLLGGVLLMIGGALDDRFHLRPYQQILFPALAALMVVFSGVGVSKVTNPFGGVLVLGFLTPIITFIWLMGMTYTTKVLDGLDGLVGGITVIGCLVVFFLTMTVRWHQPEVGILALVGAGVFSGFLFWNFEPAHIFLGEGGSTFAGFFLGVLAIISGGKFATALLVVGIPMFDLGWVIIRRTFWLQSSLSTADRSHLHFRLLDAGFSHRGAVLTFYLFSGVAGILTLVLQSWGKLIALFLLVLLMITGGALLFVRNKKNRS